MVAPSPFAASLHHSQMGRHPSRFMLKDTTAIGYTEVILASVANRPSSEHAHLRVYLMRKT